MIAPRAFVETLKKNGIRRFTGVPCSFFQAAINCVIEDPESRYTIVPNEGSALALAAGAYLAGKPTAVLIQNSGFGNLVNPLTSLHMIYHLPTLLFVSGRAYGVPDEPQHKIIGRTLGAILDAMGVAHEDMPDSLQAFEEAIARANARMHAEKKPFVFFVRKGSIDEQTAPPKNTAAYPLKRIDAIRLIAGELDSGTFVIVTTGKPSRELFTVSDRPENFYMQGSMGHAASTGLGLALAKPDKKVLVLDGDGAVLMHLGILSSIGHYAPPNFYHVVLDNEAYETTGNQDTTSSTTDLARIAEACGYRFSAEAADTATLRASLARMLSGDGPGFLRVKINRLPTEEIARISSKYTSEAIAENFKAAVAGKVAS